MKNFSGRLKYITLIFLLFLSAGLVSASTHFSTFKARLPIHVSGDVATSPHGLTPDQIKNIYHITSTGGSGTIAIIGAYDDKNIEGDLGVFDTQFKISPCTSVNGCFEKHKMAGALLSNSGWALETSMDVEWAHAIAPKAKILLVEAASPSGSHLLDAIDYARSRADVVAISMSFGGKEFPEETNLEDHFVSK